KGSTSVCSRKVLPKSCCCSSNARRRSNRRRSFVSTRFQNKTFHFWHVFVRGCRPGIYYAFRVDGPAAPSAGHRFNPNKVLIGPYARGLYKYLWKRPDAVGPEDNLATSMRCAVVDPADYDWQGDRPLKRP